MSHAVDAVVVGGGPAGSAAALTLARTGAEVVLLEATRYETMRYGETLPPGIQAPLVQLGLWDGFLSQDPLPSAALQSAWGGSQPRHHTFMSSPYGMAWHVDRRRFDAFLADAAKAADVQLRIGQRAKVVRGRDGATWQVEPWQNLGPLRSRWLVVATGRRAVTSAICAPREVCDHLVATASLFVPGAGMTLPPIAQIEAAEDGWWYSTPLPGRRVLAAFFTDADTCASRRLYDPVSWMIQLQASEHVREAVRGFERVGAIKVAAAHSVRLCATAGDGWVAVGDAAQATDPLTGNGVERALISGIQAGELVTAAASGATARLQEYDQTCRASWQQYLGQRCAYYGLEQRWPASRFWRRR